MQQEFVEEQNFEQQQLPHEALMQMQQEQSQQLNDELTEDDLQIIYNWVDEIPLSRPKRNIARDFSDGVLLAEIIKHYLPKMIDMHNYSQAHSVS